MCCLLACDSTERRTNEPSKSAADEQGPGAAEPAVEPAPEPGGERDPAPPLAPGEIGAEATQGDAAREQCIRDCVEAKMMEARAPEAIEADCSRTCETTGAAEAGPDPDESIACESAADCWVSDTTPPRPIARPEPLRGRSFRPCHDGEVAPACVEGQCSHVPHAC